MAGDLGAVVGPVVAAMIVEWGGRPQVLTKIYPLK